MDYTTSFVWLLCWPVLIYATYRLILFTVKKLEA
ncbi:hypothetical protein Sdel_1736 [Sulfurospirillum deleyianum DSM 6946]|uniref:Uncharacterized protein n=1 Tax=Sulfurospirillum deleyianum (strain ATCC 51133 / DSM 6946 / 5175) TaxID=525898 RepID=D1B3T1_SULD5|nr:hypothetical protein Sdel_1736 [Sulfurospirillum deleyianum DSM 6946]